MTCESESWSSTFKTRESNRIREIVRLNSICEQRMDVGSHAKHLCDQHPGKHSLVCVMTINLPAHLSGSVEDDEYGSDRDRGDFDV